MLQSLELFGFKSFVDRTRFDFAPGITGIVGPNGSGKSNVVDAIKWILGDQSPKSMRAKEMTDVIFMGTRGRKAAGFAEATLTFDNSSKLLPIESTVVEIGRRIWQNGDSDYLINGELARLKDIRDLFLGTGSSAYSIIEQGRVDAILQANAATRRQVLEEAAGISRYKARKTEALRKLDRVGQNLLRLTDIVDEVDAQLNSTRNQAEKAARYREVSEELKRWWIGLAADDHREHAARLTELDRVVGDFQARIEEIEGQKRESEGTLETVDAEITSFEERIRGIEQERSVHREQIAGLEATVAHLRSRHEELDGDRLQLISLQSRLDHRARTTEGLRESSAEELAEFDDQFAGAHRQLDAGQRTLDEINEQIETGKARLEVLRKSELEQALTVAACHEKVAALESRLGTLETDAAAASLRLDKVNAGGDSCREEYEVRLAAVAAAGGELERAEETVAEARRGRDQLLGKQDTFVQELSSMRERRSGHEARAGVLEELERRQEGLGLGVREILERASTSNQAPWNQISGSVADLIFVDMERAPLVDVALGERAQWIVLEELEPLGKYLLDGATRLADRVGFLAADAPGAVASVSDRDLSDQPGVVGPVSQGVQAAEGSEWLIERLLPDTWVVDTLGVALRLARGPGRGSRFVTLQGELLERDGTLLAGTLSGETSPLSRKSELRRLRQELQDLETLIGNSELQLGDLDESLVAAECDLTAARSQRQANADRVARVTADSEDQRRELESLTREGEAAEAECERISEALRQGEQELDVASRERETSGERQADLTRKAQALLDAQEQQRHKRQQAEETLENARLEVTRQEERRGNLNEVFDHRTAELRGHREQFQETRRRLDHLLGQQQQTDLQILNSRSQLADLALVDERQGREIVGLVQDRDSQRQQRSRLAGEDNRLLEVAQQLRQKQHDEELKASQIRVQFTSLEQRLQDEYQLGLEDLERSDASAFQLYLEEIRQPGPQEPRDSDADEDVVASEDAQATEATEVTAAEPPPGVTFESVRDQLESRVARLRRKLKLMGNVNSDALEDLDELEARYDHLESQRRDLSEAKATLEEIVRRINEESQRLFHESFEAIRTHFKEMFRILFGGGDGDIILEDPSDVLDCAIDIVARPPGKELRSLSLLSGGEKALTAVALVMAIFKSNPSPFCILDEVDASLDDANIERYTSMISDFAQSTQFIMVTHRKRSMTIADALYGVTMEEPGVSKRISVRFEDMSEDGDSGSPSPEEETDAA